MAETGDRIKSAFLPLNLSQEMSTTISRVIRNIQRVGLKGYWHQLQYIGDTKAGTLVGVDSFGNKYYENTNPQEETPGRHRWIDYVQHDFNASQIPPEWHAWVSHTRLHPPHQDPAMQRQPWQTIHVENLTGTRGANKTYSTTASKIEAWEPRVAERK